jgi:hypothetical protein
MMRRLEREGSTSCLRLISDVLSHSRSNQLSSNITLAIHIKVTSRLFLRYST